MKVRQIQPFSAQAPKILGGGNIEYQLWVDDSGEFYVHFEDNTYSGKFSNLLFSVSRYASIRNSKKTINQLEGYDSIQERWQTHTGNNNGGFLKAVLRHLLT